MNLSNANSQKMWDSLVSHDFGTFWTVMPSVLPREKETVRSLPIKVYLPMSNQCIAAIVKPETEAGKLATVGESLHLHLPTFFPGVKKSDIAKAVVHGVEIPLDAVLASVYYMAVYPDGWLHLSLVMVE